MANPADQDQPPPVKDAQGKDIPIHPLTTALVKDPNNPPDTVTLTGFIGQSQRDGFIRIYSDPDFRTYCEVSGDAVLYNQPPDTQHPELATTIILKATAKIELVQTVEASFLEGDIASAYPSWSGKDLGSSSVRRLRMGPDEGKCRTHGCSHTAGKHHSHHTFGCYVVFSGGGSSHTPGLLGQDAEQ